MVPACWLCEKMAHHKDNDGCPSSSCPDSSQFFFSGVPQVAVPLLEPRVSACDQVNWCIGPLKGCLDFQHPLISPKWIKFPPTFTARSCGGSISQNWTLHCSGGISAIEISLLILNHHTWVWGQPVCICPSYQS